VRQQNKTPTPEEIAEECAKIREGWSEDRWRKQYGHPKGWMPPSIEQRDLFDASYLQRERS